MFHKTSAWYKVQNPIYFKDFKFNPYCIFKIQIINIRLWPELLFWHHQIVGKIGRYCKNHSSILKCTLSWFLDSLSLCHLLMHHHGITLHNSKFMITIPDTKYFLTKLSEFIWLKFAMLILAFHMLKLAKLILRAIYLEAFIYGWQQVQCNLQQSFLGDEWQCCQQNSGKT